MPMREILLIEDMASQALFITRLLGLAFPDAAVRHERTLADGMRFATDEAPQIILCDLGLSDSAGTATIEQLRAAVPHIPIIAMTSGDRHGLECLMVGADDFLDKQDLDKPGSLQRAFTFTLTRWYRQAETKYLSQHDHLTALLTRAAVEHRYLRLLSNAREADYTVGVVLADLNYFKAVNDAYGHETGDQVLIEFGAAFENSFRDFDIVGRWGGDEFVAVVALPDPDRMEVIASRLQTIQVGYGEPGKSQHALTATYGTATAPARSSPQLDTLLRLADQQLLEAKRGRSADQAPAVPEPQEPTSRHRILLIEDNEMDVIRATQALKESEIPVALTAVTRAEEAQDLLHGGPSFDLILLDLNLPGMGGHEFLEWVKAEPEHQRTPVVILTSSSMERDTDAAWAAGTAAYLTKSQSLRNLTEDIDEMLRFYFRLSHLPAQDRRGAPAAQATPHDQDL